MTWLDLLLCRPRPPPPWRRASRMCPWSCVGNTRAHCGRRAHFSGQPLTPSRTDLRHTSERRPQYLVLTTSPVGEICWLQSIKYDVNELRRGGGKDERGSVEHGDWVKFCTLARPFHHVYMGSRWHPLAASMNRHQRPAAHRRRVTRARPRAGNYCEPRRGSMGFT